MRDPCRTLFRIGFALIGTALPATAQQGLVFPPVPGPFLVAPMMPVAPVAPPPQVQMAQPLPSFAPPMGALRMPYWMQPGVPGAGAQTAPVATGAAPATIDTSSAEATSGYGQATAPGAFPGYGATIPWAGQPQAPAGGAPQGWAFGTQPGWAATPYTPGPGWGGWAQPAPGRGN